MTVVYKFIGALLLVTVLLSNIKSRLPFSFDHITIMLIPPCRCLIIIMFIAGQEGGEVGYGKS